MGGSFTGWENGIQYLATSSVYDILRFLKPSARGNVVPAAEFNYYLDPEAAFIVLNSSIRPITILPLDVFNNQFTTVKQLRQFHLLNYFASYMLLVYRNGDSRLWAK